ncbi:hypothetical protein BRC76_08195 [Halobacteriales archaeon QH_8_67_36]|nr:MAG: hypothetical protein BRC76_08195 [Halobacteriales archaeon QH_8_67_36]
MSNDGEAGRRTDDDELTEILEDVGLSPYWAGASVALLELRTASHARHRRRTVRHRHLRAVLRTIEATEITVTDARHDQSVTSFLVGGLSVGYGSARSRRSPPPDFNKQ